GATAGRRHQAELAREDNALSAVAYAAADERLVGALAVRVGRIDQRHAEVERPMKRSDGFVVVERAVALRHAHAAETQRGHCEAACSERSTLHRELRLHDNPRG